MVSFGVDAGATLLNPARQSGNTVPQCGLSTAGMESATTESQCGVSTMLLGSPSPP